MKIEMICTITFTFCIKLKNLGFYVPFLKTTTEKWPGGCVLT